jgi:O-acetyl-ADP-ribose deacetylase (regulator of RNase III)
VARFPSGLATGDAGWTSGHDLPARWVIHVVGPDRRAGQTDPGLLESCYRRALEVADELGAVTIAFPLVSAGIYGWPVDDAAHVAVSTVRAASNRVSTVTFAAFGPVAEAALRARL